MAKTDWVTINEVHSRLNKVKSRAYSTIKTFIAAFYGGKVSLNVPTVLQQGEILKKLLTILLCFL